MTTLINGRTPEQYAAWNRWHAIVAGLLAVLLLILWLGGKGPGFATATGSCCGVSVPVAAVPPPAPAPEPVVPTPPAPEPQAAAPAVAEPPAAEPASPIPAANLYFKVDKWVLPDNTVADLEPIIAYLKANPQAVAVISGYHDPTGDLEHNIVLARNRAVAVRDYLMKSGIEEARIDMRKPIVTTGSGSLQQARRVEVSVRP